MTFAYNEKFGEWLALVMGASVFVKHNTPARTRKSIIPGVIPKIWRWYHKRMVSTFQHYNTTIHAVEAIKSKPKGWTIIEIPAKEYVTKSHLFHEIAQGLNREISQLSQNTKISTGDDYPHSIMGLQIPRQEMFNFGEELSPVVSAVEFSTYEIEWKEYRIQFPSEQFCRDMDHHYFAMAYDALNDCLYVDYRGTY